jgi:hypothetical protein
MNDVQKAAEGIMMVFEFALNTFVCILLLAVAISIIEEIKSKYFPTRYDKLVKRQMQEAEKRWQAIEIKSEV